MAITYLLTPVPKWVIMNNAGTAAGGAKLYTYRSLNKTQQKAVYQDPAGAVPWSNPIIFDANGAQGPFYWATDSTDLTDTYYLEAYDSSDVLLWTLDNYYPSSGSGGGSASTYLPLHNLIINNVFIDHINDTANPINATNLYICPSNHRGFTPDFANPISGTYGVVGPDIRLVKNNTSATDQLSFVDFSLSDGPLTGDVTPVQYMRYQCTNTPAGETYKSIQLPINQKVKNLANQQVTFRFWGATGSGTKTLTLYTRQYFGSGGSPSSEVRTSQGTFSLTTSWQQFSLTFVMPSVAGKSIGTSGSQTDDDASYLHLDMPLNQTCDIWITKPSLYLGSINPTIDFEGYDRIDSKDMTPRTGEIMLSYFNNPRGGWVAMDDGSIGNVGSGATNRANKDTFQLYSTLYTTISDTWAPVSTGRTGTGTTMAEAVTDFVAGKTLTLPRALGRALASYGSGAGLTARVLGQYLGTETISVTDMPAHTHTIQGVVANYAAGGASSTYNTTGGAGTTATSSTGGSGADGKMQPTSFMNVFIKL